LQPVKAEFNIHKKFLVLIMPTIQQLVRTGRTQITKKSKSVALDSCPQEEGFVRVFTLQHKKTKLCNA
jgi:small subunit ribosomal protein S12